MSYTVYIAVNIWNGKRYIGATGKGMAHRSKAHWEKARAGGRECPRFYDALRKHGPESRICHGIRKMAGGRSFVFVDAAPKTVN